MTVIEHPLSRTAQLMSRTAHLTGVRSAGEFGSLKLILIFSGIGLLLSLAWLTYGLDLSPGFF